MIAGSNNSSAAANVFLVQRRGQYVWMAYCMIQAAGSSGKSVGIIGGGLGGLAAACTLAARGYAVTLFDKNEWVGGKAAVLNDHGFRFDMGPTILLMPSVLRRIFDEANRSLESMLNMVRLMPQWRCFFEGGGVLDLSDDTQKTQQSIERLSPQSPAAGQYAHFLESSRRMRDISDRYYFWKSVGGIRDTFEAKTTFTPSVLKDLLSMKIGRTVAGAVRSMVHDPRVAQMLDHFTQYVGSAPDKSPAILLGIADMQLQEGIWYPMGGTRAVPVALEKLARELGVTICTSTPVKQITVQGKRACGLVTESGRSYEFDFIVSNSDTVRTHRELLQGQPSEQFFRRRRYEAACSGVVLYLGLNRRYDHLAHHNFVFSRSPEEEFDAIYRQGKPAPDPTCYLAAPARTEAAVAPPGGEALYVLVHTPYLRPGHNWAEMLPGYRDVILRKLATCGGMPDIAERIVFEAALTPADIHARYHVLDGAIYGLASHGRLNGAFKPANRSPDVAGLYFAGGSAHPGPGMPMVLMSGWIAANTLDGDVKTAAAHA